MTSHSKIAQFNWERKAPFRWVVVQIMKLFVMEFSPFSWCIILPAHKCLPQHPVLEHPPTRVAQIGFEYRRKVFLAPSQSWSGWKSLHHIGKTVRCSVPWASSERVNLYNRQIIILPRETKTLATLTCPTLLPDCRVPVICTAPPTPACVLPLILETRFHSHNNRSNYSSAQSNTGRVSR